MALMPVKNFVRLASQSVAPLFSLERRKDIVICSLNNPLKKNALSSELLKQMRNTFNELKFDPTARVVILKSSVPGTFCSGADLKERIALSAEQLPRSLANIRTTIQEVANSPIPVIAAIDGFALGGGLELALACDILVASLSSTFGFPETRLGIIPGAGGTQRLSRLIGLARAKELILTGRKILSDEALQLGLLNYTAEDPLAKSIEIAEEILQAAPVAVKMAKLAIDQGFQVEISSAISIEQQCYAQTLGTEDRVEALKAFNQKRLPVFKGK